MTATWTTRDPHRGRILYGNCHCGSPRTDVIVTDGPAGRFLEHIRRACMNPQCTQHVPEEA